MSADLYLVKLVLNADKSVGFVEADYTKLTDGSFVQSATSTGNVGYLNAAAMSDMAVRVAGEVNNNNYSFTYRNGSYFLQPEELIALRMAVENGTTTTAKALSVLGNIKVAGSDPLNFHSTPYPTTISAAEYAATGNASNMLTVNDVFAKAVPFIDNSNVAQSNQPWSIPAGSSLSQQVANQWANSSNSAIASIVTHDATAQGITPVDTSWLSHAQVNAAEQVYIAYFGRPADLAGIRATESQITAAGGDKAAITSMFANSPESQAFFAGKTVEQKVDTVYQQLFNRAAETAGKDYWVNQLTLGNMDQVNMCIRILDGAQGSDATIINNKVAAAKDFTEHASLTAYTGNTAAANGRMLISSIGADVGDVTKAHTAVQTAAFSTHLGSDISADLQLVGLHAGQYYHG